MSYVSGFMMGAAIGKSIRRMVAGGGAPIARPQFKRASNSPRVCQTVPKNGLELVSSLPGRRRYRAGVISPQLAEMLQEQLAKLSYIKTVAVNTASGSILLTFADKDAAAIDALAKWLEGRLFGGEKKKNNCLSAMAQEAGEAHAGSITRSIRRTARAFSQWIKEHTWGCFDISSLASLLFLLRGLRKMMITRQYPSGSQMLWWALTLMRGWRTV